MTREQLGLDQEDPKVLHLPKGLEVVGAMWFSDSDIEKVVIPKTVRELGEYAFFQCEKLHDVVFEHGSRLKTIGNYCFGSSGLEKIIVPRNVREIGDSVFNCCRNLRSLTFEKGS